MVGGGRLLGGRPLQRSAQFFGHHGTAVERLITDNAKAYRYSHVVREAADQVGIQQCFTRPRRPQTNGKVERYNRTFLDEWAYVRLYRSNSARARLLPTWPHTYNHHRSHTALGGRPPISRGNNLRGSYT